MLHRLSICILLFAPLMRAQTDPALLRFVPPGSKALISIDWKTLRTSHIGTLLREKFVDAPGSAIPGAEFLDDVDRCIISSSGRAPGDDTSEPPMLVVVRGRFDLAKVRKALAEHGAKPQLFNTIQVYRPQGKNARDMAFVLIDAQTILIGDPGSVFASLERSTSQAPVPDLNPLLARAAEMDSRYDVWAVMTGLQAVANDRLMGFLAGGATFNSDPRGFEAGISLKNGLAADITFLFPNEPEARSMASEFSKLMKAVVKDKIGGPAMLDLERKLKVTADGGTAKISLRLTPQEFEKNARIFAASHARPAVAAADVALEPIPAPVNATPKVIRIEGLDDGPREIRMKQQQP